MIVAPPRRNTIKKEKRWWEAQEEGDPIEEEQGAVDEILQGICASTTKILWRKGHIVKLESTQCEMSGVIPHEALSVLKECAVLSLFGNELCGGIDLKWFPQNLLHLDLSRNVLDGPFPAVASLRRLKALHLEHNKLTGSLPLDFGPDLEVLTAQNNQLCGDLPVFDSCQRLRKLWLFDNFRLTGCLEFSFPSSLTCIKSLLLTRTQVTGPVPPHLSTCDVQLLVLTPEQEAAYESMMFSPDDDDDDDGTILTTADLEPQ